MLQHRQVMQSRMRFLPRSSSLQNPTAGGLRGRMFLVLTAASYLTDDTGPRAARGSLLGRLVRILTSLKNVFRAVIPSSLFPPDGSVCGAEGSTRRMSVFCSARTSLPSTVGQVRPCTSGSAPGQRQRAAWGAWGSTGVSHRHSVTAAPPSRCSRVPGQWFQGVHLSGGISAPLEKAPMALPYGLLSKVWFDMTTSCCPAAVFPSSPRP